jgi:hypothetical protein
VGYKLAVSSGGSLGRNLGGGFGDNTPELLESSNRELSLIFDKRRAQLNLLLFVAVAAK